jgi:diadenylate cyclase
MEFVNGFIQQISNMRWSDYLDILIVAGIIYMLLPMIRSTGAMRIAKVIFGVMIIAGLAMALQLYTVSWILNQLLGVGLILLIMLVFYIGWDVAHPGSGLI